MPSPSGTVAVFSGGGTGGHLYPALALLEALVRLRSDVTPFFVGARGGQGARIIPQRGLDHLLLPVEGFRRGVFWSNLAVIWKLIRSLPATGQAFLRLQPKLVVVTGGYAGGPAGVVAGVMGIPLALMEQNTLPGITTRLLSRWARQVHLAFPEARDFLPRRARGRVRISGNPVREPVPMDQADARRSFGLDPKGRVALVVGGSQGSTALNRLVAEAVAGVEGGGLECLPGFQLLWVTGSDHLAGVEGDLERLGSPDWVRAVGYVHEMPVALAAATLAISRAGAMTTSEFLAWGIPAVLVPLPSAAANHQTLNAQCLEESGAAVHLPESELTGARLWETAAALLRDGNRLAAMAAAALSRGNPSASREIAMELAAFLPPFPEERS